MGAGKSSVGAALSRRLGWPFEDLDERIQAREQRSIEEIFRLSGEAVFRRLEHEALRSLISETRIVEMRIGETKIGDMKTGEMKTDKPGPSAKVVALGGGAFAQPNNAALLAEAGWSTIFLDAPAEELFRRCQEQKLERPLRGDANEFHRLYQDRRPFYMKAALRIETSGKDVEEVAAEAITRLGLG